MTSKDKDIYVVVLAGGRGTRFWPISRSTRPKQFLDLLGTGKSLFELAVERALTLTVIENVIVVAPNEYKKFVERGCTRGCHFLGEPAPKNTAPAIAYAAYWLAWHNRGDAVMVVLASDHWVSPVEAFTESVLRGVEHARATGRLVVTGVEPRFPSTAYGYMRVGRQLTEGVYEVRSFVEKPSRDIAEKMVQGGEYLWNSGNFTWRVEAIVRAFEEHKPEIAEAFEKAARNGLSTRAVEQAYMMSPNISVDYAILERAEGLSVVKASYEWSDLGNWNSLYEFFRRREEGKVVVRGEALALNCADSLVYSCGSGRLVVVYGVRDMIVVDTNDVVLVLPREEEQKVKEIYAEVERRYGGKLT